MRLIIDRQLFVTAPDNYLFNVYTLNIHEDTYNIMFQNIRRTPVDSVLSKHLQYPLSRR